MSSMHRTPVGGVLLSPFEARLEELHAAIVAGEDARAAELRASIETDLGARERALGLGGVV